MSPAEKKFREEQAIHQIMMEVESEMRRSGHDPIWAGRDLAMETAKRYAAQIKPAQWTPVHDQPIGNGPSAITGKWVGHLWKVTIDPGMEYFMDLPSLREPRETHFLDIKLPEPPQKL